MPAARGKFIASPAMPPGPEQRDHVVMNRCCGLLPLRGCLPARTAAALAFRASRNCRCRRTASASPASASDARRRVGSRRRREAIRYSGSRRRTRRPHTATSARPSSLHGDDAPGFSGRASGGRPAPHTRTGRACVPFRARTARGRPGSCRRGNSSPSTLPSRACSRSRRSLPAPARPRDRVRLPFSTPWRHPAPPGRRSRSNGP